MLRGTIVRVNDKSKVKHLIGTTGIAVSRSKRYPNYIKVHSRYDGYITDLSYREEELDVVEPPIEL